MEQYRQPYGVRGLWGSSTVSEIGAGDPVWLFPVVQRRKSTQPAARFRGNAGGFGAVDRLSIA